MTIDAGTAKRDVMRATDPKSSETSLARRRSAGYLPRALAERW